MAEWEADRALSVLPPRLRAVARRMLIATTEGAYPRWGVAEVAAVLAGPEMRVILEQECLLDELGIAAHDASTA